MPKGTIQRISRLALPGLCLVAMSAIAPSALAQIVAPIVGCGSTTPGGTPVCTEAKAADGRVSTGDTCGYERGATGCTANDFVANAAVTSNTIQACHIGDQVQVDLAFTIQSSQSTRYAPGLFIAENNQALNAPAGSAADTCTVATFPIAPNIGARDPFPWFAANTNPPDPATDFCGSYSPAFMSIEQVDGATVTCEPDANGNLAINFMVVYAQNSNGAALCTGPGNVAPGTTSKCTFGGSPVTNVVVTYNANPTCSLSGTGDGFTFGGGTFSKVFTITNNGPDDAGPADGNNVSFDDPVPTSGAANVVVTNATCGNAQGGAACPASVTVVGNDVSGSIPTLPNGGSVDITITGTYTEGQSVAFDNTVTLSVNDVVVTTPAEWVNTCNVQDTLPVKLQNFDVK
jgi:hypothetical protein